MRKIVLFSIAFLISVGAMAQQGDFSSTCESGQVLTYRIISSNPPQASLVKGSFQEGDLIIPEMAIDTTNTFRLYEVVSIDVFAFNSYGLGQVLGSLVIPNTVRTIGVRAFHESGFSNLKLSESLDTIAKGAFQDCVNLSGRLVLPESLAFIGENAFQGCQALSDMLVIPQSVTSIEESAFRGTGIAELDWQCGLPEVPDYAFSGCQSLTKVSFADGLEKIGDYAFSQCPSLQELFLPSSTNYIGNDNFKHSTALASICIDAPEPPYVPGSVFYNVDKSIPVYVPFGTKPLYEENYVWGRFTNIIDDPDAVEEIENEGFEVYPNPVVDQLHVACQGLNYVAVYDAQGRKIANVEAKNDNASIDFSRQASGVYFVVATNDEGGKKASRVVKE